MSFAEFPAQLAAIDLLRRSLERGRVSHAYLFSGPDLELLERLARVFAQVLNCETRANGKPPLDSCDRCRPCEKIRAFLHPDVQWIRPESKSRVILIDQIRELLQTIYLKPTEVRCKVAVIVGADRLNALAANAFLKTLEEPPSNSVFILLSNHPQQILETVLSRCLRVNLAGERLAMLTPEEKQWLANFASKAAQEFKGNLGKYQLIGLFLQELATARTRIEKELEDRSPLQQHDEIEPRLKERWEEELAAAIEAEYRRKRHDLLALLQYWFRDVWFKTLSFRDELLHFPELADLSQRVAQRLTPADAQKNLRNLEETHRYLATNVQEALALEVGFLKLNF